jgi:hypothetical protein
MELCLGRFGDRRLEKGGPFFWPVWLRPVDGSCGCAAWGAIGRERFA